MGIIKRKNMKRRRIISKNCQRFFQFLRSLHFLKNTNGIILWNTDGLPRPLTWNRVRVVYVLAIFVT